MVTLTYKGREYSTERKKDNKKPDSLETALNNVQVKKVQGNTYEVDYNGILSVYIKVQPNEDGISTEDKEQILKGALQLLYNQDTENEDQTYRRQTTPSLEALLPQIERVPDGSLGGGNDGYGRMLTVLGVFIPGQNKIKLINSASDGVLNHELGHWYAHWMGIPQPTRQVAEQLAEQHKYDGRNLYDRIKENAKQESKYLRRAA